MVRCGYSSGVRITNIPVACSLAFIAIACGLASADMVKLKSGSTVDGTILKRTDKRVWVDIGPEVLAFDMEDVESVASATAPIAKRTEQVDLFHTATDLPTLSPKEHAKILGPAVVKVSTPGGLGSGVIIDKEGHAITNAHVVQGEQKLKATVWIPQPDGTLQRVEIDKVELIAVNNHLDLALLKIPHPEGKEFSFAPVQREEKLDIGQPVFAIGNPLGLERTLTQGVISTTQRSFDGLTYIQTDTPINPGNSGGPLFNTRGEVIGITNMGIRGGEALGFAIPSRYVKDFIRNREAFSYDRNNPNAGHNYHDGPARAKFDVPTELLDGSAAK
ncbi:MAG: Serine protease Do-like HtrA [Planctomycetota bacterium]